MPTKKTPNFDGIIRDVAWTPDEFCQKVGISRQTLARWRRDFEFPIRDVGKDGFIDGGDVLDWLKSRPLRTSNV